MGGCLRYTDLEVESKANFFSSLDGLNTNNFFLWSSKCKWKSLASVTCQDQRFYFCTPSTLLVHFSVLDVFFHTRKLGHGTLATSDMA